jgi:hypothetical protein
MLEKPTCLAPCWNNITPGVTTRNQLLQMLKKDPSVSGIKADVGVPWGPILVWQVGKGISDPNFNNILVPFDSNGIVQEIRMGGDNNLYLKDFIPVYGFPEAVVFADTATDTPYVEVDLLFPKIGLVLGFFIKYSGSFTHPIIKFTKDLDVWHILFTKPGLEYYYENDVYIKPLVEYPWKGYSQYP